jgi:hypothetical protein
MSLIALSMVTALIVGVALVAAIFSTPHGRVPGDPEKYL